MRKDTAIPLALQRHLADAEIEVISWSADTEKLVLRVKKEIGPETGFLRFQGVGWVCLAPRFTIESIVSGGAETLPAGCPYAVDANERVFVLHEALGAAYSIVAESVEYQISLEEN